MTMSDDRARGSNWTEMQRWLRREAVAAWHRDERGLAIRLLKAAR